MSIKQYYIAVPDELKLSYQSFPTWKNFSFTGTLEDAKNKAIKLFWEANYFDDILEKLVDYCDEEDVEGYEDLCEKWESLSRQEKDEYCKLYYEDVLDFSSSDDVNCGLIVWNKIDNEHKKNYGSEYLNVRILN
jgi:hypothetical protein